VQNFDVNKINTQRRLSDRRMSQAIYLSFVHWQHAIIAYLYLNMNTVSNITGGNVRATKIIEATFLNGPDRQTHRTETCTEKSLRFRNPRYGHFALDDYED
jgi:hypothetical protein